MTGDDVKEGDQLTHESAMGCIYRARVDMVTDSFVRVRWLDNPRGYDILRKTSPIWHSVTVRK